MENDVNSLLKETEKLLKKGFDKDQIIKQLNVNVLPKDIAKKILFKIDDEIVKNELISQTRNFSMIKIIGGSVTLIIGLLVTFVSYSARGSSYIVAFGAIISGAWLLKEGYKESKLQDEDFKLRTKTFKKNKFKR